MDKNSGNHLIYLASPYSHIDPFVREARYLEAMRALHYFLLQGHAVYSPIVHTHPLALTCTMPKDAAFWERFNFTFIDHCDQLWVLVTEGWLDSKGVLAEIQYAHKQGKLVRYVERQKVTDVGWAYVELDPQTCGVLKNHRHQAQ